jgi:hypothetical protein
MKRIILERKSISDLVVNLTNKVGNRIIESSKRKKIKRSRQTNMNYVEGHFKIRVDDFLKGKNLLSVNYIMYFFQSQDVYNVFLKTDGENLNSEADPDTNAIKLVSGFINNTIFDDFYETISHELEHLYQYGKGMEKRNDLYERVRELLECGRNNIDAYYVGLSCYYSFKHEQDAFVHQFYTRLNQNNIRGKYEDFIVNYQPYQTMNKAYDILLTYQDNQRLMKSINYLGFTRKKFLNLVYYRLKRFDNKLYNAYNRYMKETMELTEGRIDWFINMMNERIEDSNKLGYDIEWGLESIYNF